MLSFLGDISDARPGEGTAKGYWAMCAYEFRSDEDMKFYPSCWMLAAAAAVAFCYTIAFNALFANELCLWIFSF